ncbi:MAG: cupin domain-containing protein [Thermodesulfobacteriota bacterium]
MEESFSSTEKGGKTNGEEICRGTEGCGDRGVARWCGDISDSHRRGNERCQAFFSIGEYDESRGSGAEHKHPEEHCFYMLSGRGTMYIDGKPTKVGPEMAIFAPPNVMHKMDVGPDEDLTYVVIYAPPGPEQLLKQRGERAFESQ